MTDTSNNADMFPSNNIEGEELFQNKQKESTDHMTSLSWVQEQAKWMVAIDTRIKVMWGTADGKGKGVQGTLLGDGVSYFLKVMQLSVRMWSCWNT